MSLITASKVSPDRRTVSLCQDKFETFRLWANAGLRVPDTHLVRDATDLTASVPAWLQADHDNLSAKVLKPPERDEIDAPVEEQLIVELYSR